MLDHDWYEELYLMTEVTWLLNARTRYLMKPATTSNLKTIENENQ